MEPDPLDEFGLADVRFVRRLWRAASARFVLGQAREGGDTGTSAEAFGPLWQQAATVS